MPTSPLDLLTQLAGPNEVPRLPAGASMGLQSAIDQLRASIPQSNPGAWQTASGMAGPGFDAIPGGAGATALEDVATQVGGQASKGLLGRMGILTGQAAAEAGPMLPALKSAATLKGLGYGIAGDLAGDVIHKKVKGTGGHIASGAARGAGVGAGFGLLGGPFAEVSVPVGAGVGALVGGIGGALFGGGKGKGKDAGINLQSVIKAAGGSPDTNRDVLSYYNTLIAMGIPKEDQKGKEGVIPGAASQAAQMLLQRVQEEHAQSADLKTSLAAQSMAGEFFKPSQDQVLQGANLRATLMSQLAGSLPKEFAPMALASAGDDLANANRLASAYGSQAQLIGPMTVMAQQLARQKQVEAQSFSQSLSGGGGGDFASILQQAQAGG